MNDDEKAQWVERFQRLSKLSAALGELSARGMELMERGEPFDATETAALHNALAAIGAIDLIFQGSSSLNAKVGDQRRTAAEANRTGEASLSREMLLVVIRHLEEKANLWQALSNEMLRRVRAERKGRAMLVHVDAWTSRVNDVNAASVTFLAELGAGRSVADAFQIAMFSHGVDPETAAKAPQH